MTSIGINKIKQQRNYIKQHLSEKVSNKQLSKYFIINTKLHIDVALHLHCLRFVS